MKGIWALNRSANRHLYDCQNM